MVVVERGRNAKKPRNTLNTRKDSWMVDGDLVVGLEQKQRTLAEVIPVSSLHSGRHPHPYPFPEGEGTGGSVIFVI